MKTHSHFFTDLAAGLLLFGGSLILAQTTTTAKKALATTTTSADKQAVSTPPGTTTAVQSTDAKSLDSAHATESTQRKHIAGVREQRGPIRYFFGNGHCAAQRAASRIRRVRPAHGQHGESHRTVAVSIRWWPASTDAIAGSPEPPQRRIDGRRRRHDEHRRLVR